LHPTKNHLLGVVGGDANLQIHLRGIVTQDPSLRYSSQLRFIRNDGKIFYLLWPLRRHGHDLCPT